MTEAIVVLCLWGEPPHSYTYSHNGSIRSKSARRETRSVIAANHVFSKSCALKDRNNGLILIIILRLLMSSLQLCQMQRSRVQIGLSLLFYSELYASHMHIFPLQSKLKCIQFIVIWDYIKTGDLPDHNIVSLYCICSQFYLIYTLTRNVLKINVCTFFYCFFCITCPATQHEFDHLKHFPNLKICIHILAGQLWFFHWLLDYCRK